RRHPGGGRRRPVSPGPPVPAQHRRDPPAAFAGAARGHPDPGGPFPAPARATLSQDDRRLRRRGVARPSGPFLARQHPRARSLRRARRAHGAERSFAGVRPGAPPVARRRAGPRVDEPRRGGGLPDPQDTRTVRRQREPGGEFPRPEPQRPLPPAATAPAVTSARPRPKRRPPGHERRIAMLALLGGAAAVLTALLLLWTGDYTPKVRVTLSVLILTTWVGFALAARERVVRPLQIVS